MVVIFYSFFGNITPAIKYLNIVIPAKAGIQEGTGCRIKPGMTELDYLIARLILQIYDQFMSLLIYEDFRSRSKHAGKLAAGI